MKIFEKIVGSDLLYQKKSANPNIFLPILFILYLLEDSM